MKAAWILTLVCSFVCSAQPTQPDKDQVARFAAAYRAARTDAERRAVCLDAIDSGVVAEGRSVATIDAIFGTTYAKRLPRERELVSGIVYFHPQKPPARNDVQAAIVGWYFAFKYDSGGAVWEYSLSNVHK